MLSKKENCHRHIWIGSKKSVTFHSTKCRLHWTSPAMATHLAAATQSHAAYKPTGMSRDIALDAASVPNVVHLSNKFQQFPRSCHSDSSDNFRSAASCHRHMWVRSTELNANCPTLGCWQRRNVPRRAPPSSQWRCSAFDAASSLDSTQLAPSSSDTRNVPTDCGAVQRTAQLNCCRKNY